MERKLYRAIALLVATTIAGLLVLLPYRLYERDVLAAQQHARLVSDELSNMIKLTMLTTKEVMNLNPTLGLGVVLEKVEALYKKFSESQDFKFRVVRSPLIENQFTAIKGRSADNPQVTRALETGRADSKIEGAMLTYWAPIKADGQCGHCHKDANRKPVEAGATLGVVETAFDLTRQRSRSIRTIAEITGFLLVMILLMALASVLIIRKNLVQPLHELTDHLKRSASDPSLPPPSYETAEMVELIGAIEHWREGKA